MAGTAFVGLIVADVYGRLTDDTPDRPLTAVAEAATDCPGGSFVVPAALLEDLPPSTALDSAWVREHGGFDDSPVYLLTVQGTSSTAVVLQGLRVVDVERRVAPEAPVGLSRCFGGGDVYPRRFEVDLDAPQPVVVPVGGDLDIPGDGADPAVTFPYSVDAGDPEVFWVTVANRACYCSFALELFWNSGGEFGATQIELDGGAFTVAPFNPQIDARFGYGADDVLFRRD